MNEYVQDAVYRYVGSCEIINFQLHYSVLTKLQIWRELHETSNVALQDVPVLLGKITLRLSWLKKHKVATLYKNLWMS